MTDAREPRFIDRSPTVEERLALIYDSVSDPIYLHAVEDGDGFRFLSVNRAFLQTTGLDRSQVVGRRMEDVLPESSHALVRGKYLEAIRERRRVYWTEIAEYPAGRKVGEVTVAPVFGSDGRCTHLLGSVHDVTRRVETEERLARLADEVSVKNRALEEALEAAQIARDEAQRASRAKTTFLGLVSHELATPLQIMQLNLESLERAQAAAGGPHGERIVRIRRASNRLLEMINTLLEYVRLESGHLEVRPTDVPLDELARSVVDDLAPQARQKGLALRVVAGDALVPLRTDGRLLRLVLTNLVGNAVKYTDRGHVEVAVGVDASAHVLRVTDTGRGIAPEQLSAIFEPFTQLEGLREKHTPGVGLGLTLVRELVAVLGGSVSVASTVGQGSTFTVRLPRGTSTRSM